MSKARGKFADLMAPGIHHMVMDYLTSQSAWFSTDPWFDAMKFGFGLRFTKVSREKDMARLVDELESQVRMLKTKIKPRWPIPKTAVYLPVFSISYEAVLEHGDQILWDSIAPLVSLGVEIRHMFNARAWKIYLPAIDPPDSLGLEMTDEIDFKKIEGMDWLGWSGFCLGIVKAGGVIVPTSKGIKVFLPPDVP